MYEFEEPSLKSEAFSYDKEQALEFIDSLEKRCQTKWELNTYPSGEKPWLKMT